MRKRKDRVHGPYRHHSKWRVIVVGADGGRAVTTCASLTEAEKLVAVLREKTEGGTLTQAVDEYERAELARGLRASTVTRARYHLERVLALGANGGRPLSWLTTGRAAELQRAAAEGASVDTARNGLAAAKAFGAWCVGRRLLRVNPFAALKGQGRRRRGKAQLHRDEARRLLDACFAEASPESAMVAGLLLLGCRSSELYERAVRDLDDGGRVLWIDRSKTQAGRRQLEVPEVLRRPLLELAAGKRGTDRLWPGATKDWAHYHTLRLCRAARVPEVCPQGLRGTHSTLAIQAHATAAVVSAALGHTSTAITERAYIEPGAAVAARGRAALRVLQGGRP